MADTKTGPVEKTFTATGTSDFLYCPRTAQVTVYNFGVGTIQIQGRFTGASQDVIPLFEVDDSSEITDLNQLVGPFEGLGMYIGAECTAFTSGSIKIRINRLPGEGNNVRDGLGDS